MENLGKKAKDKATGFEGIIVAKTNYLYADAVYGLQAPAKEGKIPSVQWIEESRVEIAK